MTSAENRTEAERAIERFVADFDVKWPKAVAKIVEDKEGLLAFYDFLAEHWVHLEPAIPSN